MRRWFAGAVVGLDLRVRRTSLILWVLATAVIVLLYSALYPSLRDISGIDQLLQSLPKALQEAFAIRDYTSPTGYLQAEVFSGLLPVVALVFAIGRGAAGIAGEEEADRFEALMAQPVSRMAVYLAKAAVIAVGVVAIVVVGTVVPILAVGPLFDLTIAWSAVAGMGVHFGAFLLLSGLLALATGALTGRKAVAIAVPAGVFAIGFFIETIGRSVDWLGRLRPYSPWRWFNGSQPLQNGVQWTEVGVLAAACVVVLVIGAVGFARRDLRG
ncbi:MAG TPA: hypothetical protein DHW34_07100 [Actinobacteria bacterium]|nr:hypothetical protein [Actinomycetota bacterium]